jgi:1,4-dihydroxy-2-naphthoate octaprenyltransferase
MANKWVLGARPRTLPAAVVPVAVGAACAAGLGGAAWWRAALSLVVSLSLQVGVNYANDYSDGIRGTDDVRVGPVRLVASQLASPRSVKLAAFAAFGVAATAGLVLALVSSLWLLVVGAAALLAGWFYTGGPKPYGYRALGEVAVMIFFGVVPVAGTMFTQVGQVNIEAWIGGAALGALAAAVLVVNNARDRERDATVGKRTLAVLLGQTGTRVLYIVLMLLPFGALAFYVLFYDFTVFVFFIGLAALPAMLIVATARTPREYLIAMRLTLVTAFGFGVGMAAVIAFGGILWI